MYKTAGEWAKLRIARALCRDWTFNKRQLMLFGEDRKVTVRMD